MRKPQYIPMVKKKKSRRHRLASFGVSSKTANKYEQLTNDRYHLEKPTKEFKKTVKRAKKVSKPKKMRRR